jgi:hypothetical protein
MEKISFYLDLVIKDGGIALYLVIFFGALLIFWMIWCIFKGNQSEVKKARSILLDGEHIEK